MGALKQLTHYLATGQFRMIGRAIAERIPRWLFCRGEAFLFELIRQEADSRQADAIFPSGYTCRLIVREELPACSQLAGHDIGEFYRRYDAGEICFGVFAGSRPVNINWVHGGSCYVRGMGYLFGGTTSDRYIYGIMTDPAERGRGLYKNCLKQLARHLFAHGAERLVQMVEVQNAPVLTTLPHLNYRKTTQLSFLSVLGFKRRSERVPGARRGDARWFISEPKGQFPI